MTPLLPSLYGTMSSPSIPHRICRACKYGAENAVGFLNKADLLGGGKFDNCCSTFEKIDGTKTSLADFTVSGDEDKIGDEVIIIAELSGSGIMDKVTIGKSSVYKRYSWVECMDGDVVIMPAGWYDIDSRAMVDASLADEYMELYGLEISPLGDAKDIKFNNAGGFRVIQHENYPKAALVFNGQVGKKSTNFNNFRGGGLYDVVGNNTPVPISLADIYVTGDDAKIGDEVIIIAELSASGIMDKATIGKTSVYKRYSWVECVEDEFVIMPAGWYDIDSRALVDASLADEYMELYGLEISPLGDAKDIIFTPGSAFRAIQHENYPKSELVIPSPKGL